MNPAELWSQLAAAPAAPLEELADRILDATPDVEVIAGPEVVSVPLRRTGEAGTVVIGHTTITTCQVLLAGTRGDGIRPGRDLTGAVAAAICAAAATRGTHSEEIAVLAASGAAARYRRAEQRAELVAATRLEQP